MFDRVRKSAVGPETQCVLKKKTMWEKINTIGDFLKKFAFKNRDKPPSATVASSLPQDVPSIA